MCSSYDDIVKALNTIGESYLLARRPPATISQRTTSVMSYVPSYIKPPVFGKDFARPEPPCHVVNEPYSYMTEEQIANTKKDARPFFRPLNNSIPLCNGQQSDLLCNRVDRHTRVMPSQEIRHLEKDLPLGHIDLKHQRQAAEAHNTCRGRASVRWGPVKQGERTRGHYYGELPVSYNASECYRRQATAVSGYVTMDCGRPGSDYYTQRMNGKTTWTGSSVPLHRSGTIAEFTRKTAHEYEHKAKFELERRASRIGRWPEFSDYTRSFTLRTK